MIHYANEQTKANVMHMWKTCFGDSDEFMEMYFRTKYKNENTLVEIVDNKVVSSLQMLPYSISFGKENLPVAYISGAATYPEERKKGYMENLLVASFTEMQKRNIPISTLIPQEDWLFRFYNKYGYTPMFDISKKKIHTSNLLHSFQDKDITLKEAQLKDVGLIAAFCNRILEKHDVTIQKTSDDWIAVFEDILMFHGTIFYALYHGEISGVAFVNQNSNNQILIKEIIVENEKIRDVLLKKVIEKYHASEITLVNRQKTANAEPSGMTRIIDAKRLLSAYAALYPTQTFSITVNDKFAVWNQGAYFLHDGKCEQIDSHKTDYNISINLLTQLLFGYRTTDLSNEYASLFEEKLPKMSLMLE